MALDDRLGVGDLVATMNDNPAAFDLLTAADVFLYLGDLGPAFEAAKVALRPGGLLAFIQVVAVSDITFTRKRCGTRTPSRT